MFRSLHVFILFMLCSGFHEVLVALEYFSREHELSTAKRERHMSQRDRVNAHFENKEDS